MRKWKSPKRPDSWALTGSDAFLQNSCVELEVKGHSLGLQLLIILLIDYSIDLSIPLIIWIRNNLCLLKSIIKSTEEKIRQVTKNQLVLFEKIYIIFKIHFQHFSLYYKQIDSKRVRQETWGERACDSQTSDIFSYVACAQIIRDQCTPEKSIFLLVKNQERNIVDILS